MKLSEILPDELMIPALRGTTKVEVFRELAEHVARVHPEIDVAALLEVLWERERLGSTAIGDGIAIPHGKLPTVHAVIAAFGRHSGGVDCDSLDGQPTRLFFLLVAPEDSVGLHLKALARVSRLLKDPAFRHALLDAPDGAALAECIRREDQKI